MPAAQVEFDDGQESLGGIIDGGNMQEHLGVAHEATNGVSTATPRTISQSIIPCILCYSLEHASRLENKGRQDHATQVGARAQLRDDVGEDCILVSIVISVASGWEERRGEARKQARDCEQRKIQRKARCRSLYR